MRVATVTALEDYRRARLPEPGAVPLRVSIEALSALDARAAMDGEAFLNEWERSFCAHVASRAEHGWTVKQRMAARRTVAKYSERLSAAGYSPCSCLADEIHAPKRGGPHGNL